MDVFQIIGPVMIGPSSSHTAGAVRIGRVVHALLGVVPVRAVLELHQSFARTCRGHGTDKALIAGLLGFSPDDQRIRDSLRLAAEQGLTWQFSEVDLKDAHPNSVRITAAGKEGEAVRLVACSIGGGRIQINEVDDLPVDFSGDYPTILLLHQDRLGLIAEITRILAGQQVNIANMQVFRSRRLGQVATFIEADQPVDAQVIKHISDLQGIDKAICLEPFRES